MIPKTIIQTSIHRPPEHVVDKILAKIVGWTYLHFDDEAMISFFQDNYLEEFKDIVTKFHSITSGPHKTDLFRYYYLYLNGGVYMDTDAMLKLNLDDIVKDYTFISVNSTYIKKSIFQGFLGVTPRNDIIYKALQNIYIITMDVIKKSYHVICRNLYDIVQTDETNPKLYLLKEKYHSNDAACIYDDENNTVLIHYWNSKVIPM
jgi:mannosyltransferase OCH1-like enzyme